MTTILLNESDFETIKDVFEKVIGQTMSREALKTIIQ